MDPSNLENWTAASRNTKSRRDNALNIILSEKTETNPFEHSENHPYRQKGKITKNKTYKK